jgi:uncharacterized protein with ParB-like and HNH nuclease domain
MRATNQFLTKLLEKQDTHFIIPIYQRNYDWGMDQCQQLLDDICQLGDEKNDGDNHFIGSLVFIQDGVTSCDPPEKLLIIDGQQRLTTVTLLWVVLHRIAKELGDEKLENEIHKKYLVNEFLDDDEKLKLRSTSNNDEALRYLIKDGDPQKYDKSCQLVHNFNYFKSEINKHNYVRVIRGIRKLMFVEIVLERDKDDPQRIFESLNSTGTDLTPADLIRNYMLMRLDPNLQKKMYQDYWMKIERLATKGENTKSQVDLFIRDFLTIKTKEIPLKRNVYRDYKKFYTYKDKKTLEDTMKEIKNFANHYNKLINPGNEPDVEIRNQIKLVTNLGVDVCFPFFLNIYNDYANHVIDKKTLIGILELIQSYIWRRFIVGIPTQGLDRIFARLYDSHDASNYLTSISKSLIKMTGAQRFPADDETLPQLKIKDLYNIKINNRTYFLERLENHNNKEPVKIEGNPDITTEHIFPQKPSHKWTANIPQKECDEIKEKYLHTIGNLTLIGTNSSLSNKSFLEKRDLPGKGYSASRLFLNKHLSALKKWDKKEIQKRAVLLQTRFKEIWTYPDVKLDEKDKNEEVNVFNEYNPTYKRLEYIVFMDKKITVGTFKELYREVCKSLFYLDPNKFIATDLGQKIKLVQATNAKESKLINPVKVSDNYFIEGSLSSKGIISKVQLALKTCQMTDDLYLKYK